MNKVKNFENKVIKTLFSKVLENTLVTIFLTAILSSGIVLYFDDLIKQIYKHRSIFIPAMIAILVVYMKCRREKKIKKVTLNEENLKKEWKNNEFRVHIPSIAEIKNKALFLQFMDIPFTLEYNLPDKYALEFKAKVINHCFSWCTNVKIDNTNKLSYMFQYNPQTRRLRPNFLVDYDATH